MFVSAVLQVVLAVVVVVLLFVAAFQVYNSELLRAATTKTSPKQRVDIFLGIKDLHAHHDETYQTVNPTAPAYKDLALSINQVGGAEFAYNFWLYKPAHTHSSTLATGVDDALSADDVVLLLRGSKRKQRFFDICGEMQASGPPEKNNIMVKCPLIKLQRSENGAMDVLTVELNTKAKPDGVHEMSRNRCNTGAGATVSGGTWSAMNAHKLAVAGLNSTNYIEKWFMVTVVIRDTNPGDKLPVRNKIQVQIYINGTLELERYVDNGLGEVSSHSPSILQQNYGPLYVAPFAVNGFDTVVASSGALSSKPFFMANLSYFNYGLTPADVGLLYTSGFSKSVAPSISAESNSLDAMAASFGNVSVSDGKVQLRAF